MDERKENRLLILFATQTGCSEELADQLTRSACRRNFIVNLCSIEEYDISNLINEPLVFFVCSTTGDGEVPDSMKPFWHFLLRRNLPKTILSTLNYTIFGLGDSSYPQFNSTAKKLHQRLLNLGAKEIFPIGLGDDQSALGVEDDFDKWLKSLWDIILSLPKYKLPQDFVISNELQFTLPNHKIIFHTEKEEFNRLKQGMKAQLKSLNIPEDINISDYFEYQPIITSNGSKNEELKDEKRIEVHNESYFKFPSMKDNPMYEGKILINNDNRSTSNHIHKVVVQKNIIDDDDDQEMTREEEEEEEEKDVLILFPKNLTKDNLFYLLSKLNINIKLINNIKISLLNKKTKTFTIKNKSIYEIFTSYFDYKKILNKSIIEILYSFISLKSINENKEEEEEERKEEKEKLKEIIEDNELFSIYIKKENRNIINILKDFKYIEIPLIFIPFLILFPFKPRLYSLASSIKNKKSSSREYTFYLSYYKYLTPFKRLIHGTTSKYLSRLDLESLSSSEEREIYFSLKRGSFKIRKNWDCLILIGLGTGMSPLYFILNQVLNKKHPAIKTILLFQGSRTSENNNFLFCDEYLRMIKQLNEVGVELKVLAAFSRNQGFNSNHWISYQHKDFPKRIEGGETIRKLYIQQLFKHESIRDELSERIIGLNTGVFVCGGSKNIPRDIKDSLIQTVEECQNMNHEDVVKLFQQKVRKRSYVVEAWN